MKKVLLGLIVFGAIMVLNTTNSLAQYEKGDKLLNLGIGLNSYYFGGIPLAASLEIGITDDISVGPAIGYQSKNYGSGSYNSKWTSVYIGGRGSYHLNKIINLNEEKLDLYAGAQLGYQTFKWKDDYVGVNPYNNGDLRFGIYGGGRYYFQNNIAILGELGFGGYSNANIGVTFKF